MKDKREDALETKLFSILKTLQILKVKSKICPKKDGLPEKMVSDA